MNERKTYLIVAFPECGVSYAMDHFSDEYKFANPDPAEFKYTKRKRTKEELDAMRKRLEDDPSFSRINPDDYVEMVKNELITVMNPGFPANYFNHVKNLIGEFDYIFLSSTDKNVFDFLNSENIPYNLVFPKPYLKYEWVGRYFSKTRDSHLTEEFMLRWDEFLNQFLNETLKHKYIMLGPSEYLSEYLFYKSRGKADLDPAN